jgi:hypothetical protein
MVPQFAMALPRFTADEAKRRFFLDRARATPEALAEFYEKALDPEKELPLAPEYAARLLRRARVRHLVVGVSWRRTRTATRSRTNPLRGSFVIAQSVLPATFC